MDNQTLCQQITQTINNVSITNCSKITVNQHINPSARNYNLKEKSAWKDEVCLARCVFTSDSSLLLSIKCIEFFL